MSQPVEAALVRSPLIGVVRTSTIEEARRRARLLAEGGIELIEVTFTVPDAPALQRELLGARDHEGPPFFGMGTVTTPERAQLAVAAGAEFLVAPNTHAEVARIAREAGLFFVLGALTASEVVRAVELGSKVVKIYPVGPVGGPAYLRTLREPLGDVVMSANGGYAIEDVPEYRAAGATVFGIGGPLFADSDEESLRRIRRALALARGEADAHRQQAQAHS